MNKILKTIGFIIKWDDDAYNKNKKSLSKQVDEVIEIENESINPLFDKYKADYYVVIDGRLTIQENAINTGINILSNSGYKGMYFKTNEYYGVHIYKKYGGCKYMDIPLANEVKKTKVEHMSVAIMCGTDKTYLTENKEIINRVVSKIIYTKSNNLHKIKRLIKDNNRYFVFNNSTKLKENFYDDISNIISNKTNSYHFKSKQNDFGLYVFNGNGDTKEVEVDVFSINKKSDVYLNHNNIPIDIAHRGIMLIAFGYDYEKISVYCVKSINKHCDLPIIIHTNIPTPNRNPMWEDTENTFFIFHNLNDSDNRLIKTDLYNYTRFKQTLYIDVDSQVLTSEFLEEFDNLSKYDIILPHWNTYSISDMHHQKNKTGHKKWDNFIAALDNNAVDAKIKLVGGGICFFNKNNQTKNFFKEYNHHYKYSGNMQDMPSLNYTMQKNICTSRLLNNKYYNGSNSLIIKSLHSTNIKYPDLINENFSRTKLNSNTGEWGFCKQGTTEIYTKPKIIFLYDCVGWAFYNKAQNIKHHLYMYYDILIIKYGQEIPLDCSLIISFSPSLLNRTKISKNTLIASGVSSNKNTKNILKAENYSIFFSNSKSIIEHSNHPQKYYLPNGVNFNFFNKNNKMNIIDKKSKIIVGAVGSKKWESHKGKYRIKKIVDILSIEYNMDVEFKPLYVDPINEHIKTATDMAEYYDSIDILVISSVSETAPNPLLEAVSSETLVVSNKTGLSPHILHEDALVESYDNIDEYIDRLVMLILNSELQKKVIEYSIIKIQDYTWEKCASGYKKMIDDNIKR